MKQYHDINDTDTCRKAGYKDLIRLNPVVRVVPEAEGRGAKSGKSREVRTNNAIYAKKFQLVVMATAIEQNMIMHASGATGTGKTSLIHAVADDANWAKICRMVGIAYKPVKLFVTNMVSYETPQEIERKRELKNATTFDAYSDLVRYMVEGNKLAKTHYPLIFIKEIGRAHSPAVQNALVTALEKPTIYLFDGTALDIGEIRFVMDSNYVSEEDDIYVLTEFDTALKRRVEINLTCDYLSPEEEAMIVVNERKVKVKDLAKVKKVVQLGQKIRVRRKEGNLQSLTPPTIYGYLAAVKLMEQQPDMPMEHVMGSTLLGSAKEEDSEEAWLLYDEVFGLRMESRFDGGLSSPLA